MLAIVDSSGGRMAVYSELFFQLFSIFFIIKFFIIKNWGGKTQTPMET